MIHSTDKQNHSDIHLCADCGWTDNCDDSIPHYPFAASDKAKLGQLAQVVEYKTEDSRIFSQGENADYIYLLVNGLIRVSHTLANGMRHVVAFHWPGDLFGLAYEGNFVNSAEIIIAVRVYRFPVHKLEQFLLKNP